MDLVAGVRKEGSRGGRADFKWEDVKDDAQRENYLGHSLMAPVGRWQRGRDLNWYAKTSQQEGSDGPVDAAAAEAEARKEEIRKIKQAEQDALSEALGYGPLVPKQLNGNANANGTPLGRKDVEKAIKEGAAGEDGAVLGEGGDGEARGIGFGGFEGMKGGKKGDDREVMDGVGMDHGGALDRGRRDGYGNREGVGSRRAEDGRRRHRSGERGKRRRSRSRDRSSERRRRRRRELDEQRHHNRRHRSHDRGRHQRHRERSRSYDDSRSDEERRRRERRRRDREDGDRRMRSYSPDRRRDSRHDRYHEDYARR